jgi:hypothetical protein
MRIAFLTALACASLVVKEVSADPLMKYDFVDLAYQWTRDTTTGVAFEEGGHGLDTKLSYVVADNIALEGGYNYTDFSDFDVNVDRFRYGVALWNSICDGMDVVGRLGGIHQEFSSDFGSETDSGVYGGVQLRTLLSDDIEGNADVLYDYVDGNGTWTYGLTAITALGESFGLKTGATIDNDGVVALLAGLRFTM